MSYHWNYYTFLVSLRLLSFVWLSWQDPKVTRWNIQASMVSYPGDNPEEYLIKDGTEYFFFQKPQKVSHRSESIFGQGVFELPLGGVLCCIKHRRTWIFISLGLVYPFHFSSPRFSQSSSSQNWSPSILFLLRTWSRRKPPKILIVQSRNPLDRSVTFARVWTNSPYTTCTS